MSNNLGSTEDHNIGDKNHEHPSNTNLHTGSQMTSLITNSRPILPQTKMVPKKLSVNASKILFPIRE